MILFNQDSNKYTAWTAAGTPDGVLIWGTSVCYEYVSPDGLVQYGRIFTIFNSAGKERYRDHSYWVGPEGYFQ